MSVPALSAMAQRACIKNIRAITDIGDTPYKIVRPILLKIENPAQLRQIEEVSPQIIGQDAEIWREFIKRDVLGWEDKPHEPSNPQNWHKVYKKLVRENDRQMSKDAEILKAAMDGYKDERFKNKIERVELDFVKLRGDMTRSGPTIRVNQSLRFVDRGALHNRPPSQRELKINRGELDADAPNRAPKPAKSKLEFLKKDQGGVRRFKNEAKRPTGIIKAREMALKQKPTNTTITKAPARMIESYKNPVIPKHLDPTTQPTPVFIPRKRKIEHEEEPRPAKVSTAERERRLKAFTNPSSISKGAPIVKAPRSQAPPLASPPPHSSPPSQIMHSIEPESSLVASPKTQPTSNSSPSIETHTCKSSTPNIGISCSRTSSPSNGGLRPSKMMKRKPPADIFMRPQKRTRVA